MLVDTEHFLGYLHFISRFFGGAGNDYPIRLKWAG